jgi:site-specific DNA-methyltransferase (adenine-specific)
MIYMIFKGENLLELNKIYCMDNVEGMKQLDDESIDLTVTSPPYDNLRSYNGFAWDFEGVANQLFRITKQGRIVVWVVGDATINGNESGTSFEQALYFKKVGFNLLDTMIYSKGGQGATGSNNCYWQDFEYMFIFTKGKIKIFNPIKDRENKVTPRERIESQGHRYKNGDVKEKRAIKRNQFGKRFNIWKYHESGTRLNHPAIFPEQLANDHILSWSNEGDLVFDPFMGSGTTAKMAKLNNRNYIGFETSQEYCDIAEERLNF